MCVCVSSPSLLPPRPNGCGLMSHMTGDAFLADPWIPSASDFDLPNADKTKLLTDLEVGRATTMS